MAFCAFVEKFIVAVVRPDEEKRKRKVVLRWPEEEGVCVCVGVERRFFICVRRLFV